MNPRHEEKYSRLFHRRLTFTEDLISKAVWLSAGIAVIYFNSDENLAAPRWITWTTICVNVGLPFIPSWRTLIIERPKRLARTERRLQVSVFCLLYLILILFLIKKTVLLAWPWF